MNSAVENSAVEHTEAEEDSESPLAKRAKTSSRDDTLPPALEGLTEKDYKRIISEEVVLDKDHSAHGYEKGETYSMAMAVASKDGDQPAIDISKLHLSKLHLSKLRKLAKNFGIKMISKMPSAVIRIHLARNAHIGSILDNATKIKSPPSHAKRMQNTIVRLVNVIFSHGFIQGLMKWNNHRKRADHETGVGGTMDRFFVQVHTAMYAIDEDDGGEEKIPDVADREDDRSIHSFDAGDAPDDSLELEHVNLVLERTTNDNDPYASLSRFEERTDLDHEKVGLYFELADPDPGQYMKLPSKMLRGWTGDLLRARKKLIENMKRSGEHDSDVYSFVQEALKKKNFAKQLESLLCIIFV
ncbi:hypothetical protein IV203_008947 [Nitzschia inconspicua]|uniref:Uncharacterized protein n=1 Tax=Nitzschia inconspicua TaxID=303405 RepID=A0A9K3L0J2_9STRA|nr:hypothetical protein IV203_008947 [Nitzschia inconspicua]